MGETRPVALRVSDPAAAERFYREAFGVGLGSEVAFDVDDLEEAHARAIAAGAEVVRGPAEGSASYRDPDGTVGRPETAAASGSRRPGSTYPTPSRAWPSPTCWTQRSPRGAQAATRGEALPLPEGHEERIGAIWR